MGKLIGLVEVREYFNVGGSVASRSYVQSLVKNGTLPKPVRIGKKLAWYEDKIIEARAKIMDAG